MSNNHLRTVPQAPFRIGVLGCGEQGYESRIPAALALADDGVEVPAVADFDLERARWVAEDLGVRSAYRSFEDMVEQEELDGVIVVLPPAAHRKVVIDALRRGLHVFCEKPFGGDAQDAREMIGVAKIAERVLATGYQYPVATAWSLEHVREMIGAPYLLEATWKRSANGSDRGIPDRPGFWNRAGGRGVGADLLSHLLSTGLRILGSEPAAVSARSWSHQGHRVHGDEFKVEDTLSVIVDFTDGARGQFTAAWGADILEDELGISCQGIRGSIKVPLMAGEIDAEAFRPTVIGGDGLVLRGDPPVPTEEAFVVQQRNWVAACRGEAELFSRPEDALKVHRVLDAAYRSTEYEGAQITL
jgi:predicted dehydrogenase